MTKEQKLFEKLKDFENQEIDKDNPNLELTLKEVKLLNAFLVYVKVRDCENYG